MKDIKYQIFTLTIFAIALVIHTNADVIKESPKEIKVDPKVTAVIDRKEVKEIPKVTAVIDKKEVKEIPKEVENSEINIKGKRRVIEDSDDKKFKKYDRDDKDDKDSKKKDRDDRDDKDSKKKDRDDRDDKDSKKKDRDDRDDRDSRKRDRDDRDYKRKDRNSYEDDNEERMYVYPCGNKFNRYRLDDDPEEYGIKGGEYEKGKAAYVGIVDANELMVSGRIQLSPPGIVHGKDFQTHFVNDSSKIWYLYNDPNHMYEWVRTRNDKKVPFAIDFGSDTVGDVLYIGRVKLENNLVDLGTMSPATGQMYYINNKGVVTATTSNYQILTCKSSKSEKNIPTPKQSVTIVPPETGCINNWVEYTGDNTPTKNGIAAGSFDCGNTAYVGKGPARNVMLPGRIQTVGNAGLYYVNGGRQTYITNGSYFLADNPNYTYSWVDYDGDCPENSVNVRSSLSAYFIPIPRAKINGRMQIGNIINHQVYYPGNKNSVIRYSNSEVLVCDPWPKYQCGQEWKKYACNDAPSVDGFNIGNCRDDTTSYIGRGTREKCNGQDYELGRIQISPSNASGLYYLDEQTSTEKFDNSTAEYLVKNPKYFYRLVGSRSGAKVENALELHKEGHRPFYIGVAKINEMVFVGKVRPGEGLFYIGSDGKQNSISSYDVLTCTSSDASNEVYKERSDESWFGSFGCPLRKEWNFKLSRCVCKDEFKGILKSSNAKWNEDTCSYSV